MFWCIPENATILMFMSIIRRQIRKNVVIRNYWGYGTRGYGTAKSPEMNVLLQRQNFMPGLLNTPIRVIR